MDIVVKGRNVEVPDHYRVHVSEKLSRLERYDRKIVRFDVELFHEPNRRQHKNCQRVEITTQVRGQVICAAACAGDFYGALDSATNKLESRLRRIHDRRRVHYGRRSPASVGQAVSAATPIVPQAESAGEPEFAPTMLLEAATDEATDGYRHEPSIPEQRWTDDLDDYQPGHVVAEKKNSSQPMSVESALSEMELVGHDFYLFTDADNGLPSVVYRRKGFAYGVVRLT
jgi:ribosomal subunit interface protein